MENFRLKDGELLTVREAMASDVVELLTYVEQISGESDYLTFGPGEFELTEAQGRTFLTTCAETINQVFLVGAIDGAIVSTARFVGGHRTRERHTGMIGLSVEKRFWRRGIGMQLMKTLISWAVANPIVTKLQLKVRTDNESAISLYQKLGFVTEGTVTGDMCVDGQYFDHHLMAQNMF